MAKTVVGMFEEFGNAEDCVRDLQSHGFRRDDISLIMRDRAQGGQFSETETGTEHRAGDVSKGAAAGAGTGAVLGGLAGLLVGLGALAIPGIGPIVAAGPIAMTLAGAGAGAVAGGIVGALVDAGVPEEQANVFAEGVRRGNTLVMVKTSDEMAGRAADIINRYHPIDMKTRSASWREHNWTGFDETAQPYGDSDIARERDTWRTTEVDRDVQSTSTMGTTGTSRNFDRDMMTAETTGAMGTPGTPRNFDQDTPTAGMTGTSRDFDRDMSATGTTGGMRDFNAYNSDFRGHFDMLYASRGHDYDYYQPGYRFGYDLAGNSLYRGRRWSEVEPEARREWERSHPGNAWDDFKDSIRHAWERVTGSASDTGSEYRGDTWTGSGTRDLGTGTDETRRTDQSNW